MVDKLQEERVSAATEAESVKRRTGEVERNFDLLETEKLGLERSVFTLLLAYLLALVTCDNKEFVLSCCFPNSSLTSLCSVQMWHVLPV